MTLETKHCRKCGTDQPVANFHKDRSRKTGLAAYCKICVASRQETYFCLPEIKAKKSATDKAYRAANAVKIAARRKASHLANKEQINEARRLERQGPRREHILERDRLRRIKNAKAINAAINLWRKNNPDKVAAQKARRHSREQLAPGGPFKEGNRPDYQPRVIEFKGMCAYCLEHPFEHMDHAVPLSRGGTNYPENVWPVCKPCNRGSGGKHSKILYEEWIPPKDRHIARERIKALILALGS